jgi:hypothetical protein
MGVDFIALGKTAVLHSDYPERMQMDRGFSPNCLPVTADYLRAQGLGERFISYLSSWTNFVSDRAPPTDVPRFDIAEYLKRGATGK